MDPSESPPRLRRHPNTHYFIMLFTLITAHVISGERQTHPSHDHKQEREELHLHDAFAIDPCDKVPLEKKGKKRNNRKLCWTDCVWDGHRVLGVVTLQVEHQQLSAGVLVGPVAEGQHGFLQEVCGHDLISVVVVELPELPGDAFLYSKPLASRVTVEQKHLQEPEHKEDSGFTSPNPTKRLCCGFPLGC